MATIVPMNKTPRVAFIFASESGMLLDAGSMSAAVRGVRWVGVRCRSLTTPTAARSFMRWYKTERREYWTKYANGLCLNSLRSETVASLSSRTLCPVQGSRTDTVCRASPWCSSASSDHAFAMILVKRASIES